MSDLENLYIKRNEAYKVNDIETVNNITEELNNLYPVKPKSVLCIDGKPVQFEIIGLMSGAKGEAFTNGNDGRAKFYLNGKGVYARLLIKILA